jgi:hypothetical protein
VLEAVEFVESVADYSASGENAARTKSSVRRKALYPEGPLLSLIIMQENPMWTVVYSTV